MSDRQTQDREEAGAPVPRDLPDQQAQGGEDPLDEAGAGADAEGERAPDTDQDPVPDEPPS